jgi:transcriptional regulator with XRE-family HTH domain
MDLDEKAIVEKIKRIRLNKGISLKSLAETTGLTQGYLSRIENSDNAPPIGTLDRIAKGLGTDVSYLLGEQNGNSKENPSIVVNRFDASLRVGTTSFPSARPVHGYHYQALSQSKLGKNMETFVITPEFAPGEVLQHEGEEFIYVLEGCIEFHYGDEKIVLNRDDSAYFDTSVPHNGKSLGDSRARVLIVTYSYKRI